MSFEASQLPGGKRLPGTREMVAMLAGLMALNAFAIDAMIPALPQIGRDLGVASENSRQLVVVAYFIGFGSTQLIWGPLADRFGRKPVLAAGISLYTAFALLCAIAGSFPLLIAGRVAMGASAAVTRVLVVAMVRDLFESEAMARVMSLVFMVFMLVPVLAPSVGQAILLVGQWRAIFLVLAAYGLIMLLWSGLRLPETLHPEYRRSLAWRDMGGAMWETIREPLSRGYTLALAVTFGALTAYIASIQQIVFDAFHAPGAIGLVFGAVAAPMALASWTNSKIVGRFGLRRVGHGGDRGSCRRRAVGPGEPDLVHHSAGAGDGLLCFHLIQSQHASDGAYGADRRHGFGGTGRDRHHRRRRDRLHHRPVVRWDGDAVHCRHRRLRYRRHAAGRADRAEAAVRAKRNRRGRSRAGSRFA